MKALALLQPWADAVVYFGKNLENRTWSTSFRGEFFIQASASVGTRQVFHDNCESLRRLLPEHEWLAFRGMRLDAVSGVWRPTAHLKLGGIIGRALLVDVLPPCAARPQRPKGKPAKLARSFLHAFDKPCAHRWHAPTQYAFVLEDIRRTTFVPFRGALGLVNVPDDVAHRALA